MPEITDVGIQREGGVTILEMRNPGKKNAFDQHLLDTLTAELIRAGQDDAVRAVILTGEGDAFCAGGDVSAMGGDTDATGHLRYLTEHIHTVARALMDCPKPTIAMINGPAVGAGLDIALACDLRVAARSAVLREGYIRVGLSAGDGGAWLLPRIVGRGRALELLLTARGVSADEAERIGLVTLTVPDASLRERTLALARRLQEMPPNAVTSMKRLVNDCAEASFSTGLSLSAQSVAVLQSSHEHAQALQHARARRLTGNAGRKA
ncbi:enoyl-CoA hydratase/isomerase family protein [Streptomyces iranensis]|uniref:Enoyl-CoA hydratase/carnithine racemase n=1 Tax=Streptomyces iranensis TaxID=576784 RepID=A0A060ZZA2_9ACTN|nr:enoyl-CoA hydratase/isomerase family protein [Streptomyces iranensis]MBP2066165.1 enoyl-CoA hydratase/carnithine racemase [Streptomyces iranensis]CDR13155.1 Enoyl-CoA hydratase/isomerase [Streptomyces iranensis]